MYRVFFVLIILLALFLRFNNYENRWGLALDQAHDVLVARGSLELDKIPLVGPFSSAGPFQTSGIWYWLVIVGVISAPWLVNAPWIFVTSLFLGYVGLMIFIGERLEDKKFGLFVGLLTAVSTAQITQAVNLTVTAPMAIISAFAILMMIRYLRKKSAWNLFFLTFFISLAPTMHTQGYTLFFLLLITCVIAGTPKLRILPYAIAGLIIPFLPMLVFDFKNEFINSRSIIHYFIIDQHKVSLDVLGRRWLTYLGEFWPNAWSYIIGGNRVLGYFFIISIIVMMLYKTIRGSLAKDWLILGLSFITSIIIVRYVHTPIFDSYLVMQHTFVLLFSSYVIYLIFQKSKALGIAMLSVVVILTSIKSIQSTLSLTNSMPQFANNASNILINRDKTAMFSLYDFKYLSTDKSLPISMYLTTKNKASEAGLPIGIVRASAKELKYFQKIATIDDIVFVDLAKLSSKELRKDWGSVSSSEIYSVTEEWYHKR